MAYMEDIYDKFEKKNERYKDKIKNLDAQGLIVSTDMDERIRRSKSTNQTSADWYRKWQNKQSADFDLKIDVRSAEKGSAASRKGSTASRRSLTASRRSTKRRGSRNSSESSSSSSSDSYEEKKRGPPVKSTANYRTMSNLEPVQDTEEGSDESDTEIKRRSSGSSGSGSGPSAKSLGSISSDASVEED
jgi:Polycystin cation channel